MNKNKFISIIIVNYNGKHLLNDCFNSLAKLNYPKDLYEVIMVDNDSKDSSISFVKSNFPEVIIVESKENTGFTGGNQLGLERAKGDYIILLNNDTAVDKNWLKEIVKSAKNKKTGIVTSKLFFDTPFIELTVKSNSIPKSSINSSANFSPIGILIEDLVCNNKKIADLIWYKSGFKEKKNGDLITRWTKGEGKILLPFGKKDLEKYSIKIHGYPSKYSLATPVEIAINNKIIFSGMIASNEVEQINFELKREDVKNNFINLVQNAGNIILKDGYSKDRGSVLRINNKERLEFYEEDNEYFNKKVKLLASCGAACLIKRELIDKIGFLDGHYFMYYEDVDFSLRTWRTGWDIVYSPRAIVRHKHKASTGKAESDFFLHMVERNHLAFVLTHFPASTVINQMIEFLIQLIITLIKFNLFRFKSNMDRTNIWRIKSKARIKTFIFLVNNILRLIKNRISWKKREKRSYKIMKKLLY